MKITLLHPQLSIFHAVNWEGRIPLVIQAWDWLAGEQHS